MLKPAALRRALAGALGCALILCAAMAHQARADDRPMAYAPAVEGVAGRPAQIAILRVERRHLARPRRAASARIGRAWSASRHPLVTAALRDLGRGKFTRAPGPWCADGLNVWLARAGYRPLASRRARDFAGYGYATGPRPGAIVVMRGHVGVLIRPGVMVSANWSRRVGIGAPRGVIAYRAPV